MRIVMCGSVNRAGDEMKEFADALRRRGFEVIDPSNAPYYRTHIITEKLQNKLFYNRSINVADVVMIYNKDGYIGLATAMEIQYAIDHDKSVILLFKPSEIEFKALLISGFDICIDSSWLKYGNKAKL